MSSKLSRKICWKDGSASSSFYNEVWVDTKWTHLKFVLDSKIFPLEFDEVKKSDGCFITLNDRRQSLILSSKDISEHRKDNLVAQSRKLDVPDLKIKIEFDQLQPINLFRVLRNVLGTTNFLERTQVFERSWGGMMQIFETSCSL